MRIRFVTTTKAAEMPDVTVATICKMLRDGILKGIKIGKGGKTSDWRINKKILEDYIAKAS